MNKISSGAPETPLIRDLIRERQADLTASERRLTALLLDESLVVGLQSITRLAENAEVSTPTVVRLARKLGFGGFPDFQNAIREEIAARMKEPLAKLDPELGSERRDHIISRFARAMSKNINSTIDRLDTEEFDQVVSLLSDANRKVSVLGGRISRSNAHYFFNHLQIIRPGVTLMDSSPSVWPQALLDMDAQTVLVVFDIRRYEKELDRLAAQVAAQGGTVVLFTDQWGSPIERNAAHCFRTMVEVPSSWDSTLAINFLLEAMVAAIQAACGSTDRLRALEDIIGDSRIFRGGRE
ncbi:MurR/RpiR family transcriptional regulator [Gymnodinialimonas hymeniacidonis]|uniref:MurR/RpiR family transcriptional regulator n=1 Tax=Gymnodinialimonas hymeniacidonis TaxID=3126508 RepID=UPI0034C63A29